MERGNSSPLEKVLYMLREYRMVNTVDDSVKVVAAHFITKMLSPKKVESVKVVKTKAAKKVTAKKVSDLRVKAFALFTDGKSAANVRDELSITYANAHYYKRAWKKEQ